MNEVGPGDHPLYLIYINDAFFEMMYHFCLCEFLRSQCVVKDVFRTKPMQTRAFNFLLYAFFKSDFLLDSKNLAGQDC